MTDPANGAMGRQAFARNWALLLVVVHSGRLAVERGRARFVEDCGYRAGAAMVNLAVVSLLRRADRGRPPRGFGATVRV